MRRNGQVVLTTIDATLQLKTADRTDRVADTLTSLLPATALHLCLMILIHT